MKKEISSRVIKSFLLKKEKKRKGGQGYVCDNCRCGAKRRVNGIPIGKLKETRREHWFLIHAGMHKDALNKFCQFLSFATFKSVNYEKTCALPSATVTRQRFERVSQRVLVRDERKWDRLIYFRSSETGSGIDWVRVCTYRLHHPISPMAIPA